MSRKLLQNQPLKQEVDDLESVSYFGSQEKKVTFDPQVEEEEVQVQSGRRGEFSKDPRAQELNAIRTEFAIADKKEAKERKANHHMQILDEDAEKFKIKLEDMVNKFKSETMSEFMGMKRSLLEEQNEAIESETRKYTRILETRNNELDRTKETLAVKIKAQERSEVILHVIARWCGEAKVKKNNAIMLSKYFAQFRLFKEYMKMKRKLAKIAATHSKRNYLRMFFNAWKDQRVESKEQKVKVEFDEQLNHELSDLAAKYNKEIDLLSQKLAEANEQLEIANKHKIDMQDNLKKAFMRGVCALNFEAMNILDTKGESQQDQMNQMNQTLADRAMREATNMYNTQTRPSYKTVEEMESNKENYANPLIVNPIADDMANDSFTRASPAKKSVVFYQNPRLESKEGRWKDAPLVGTSGPSKLDSQQKVRIRDFVQQPIIEHEEPIYHSVQDGHQDEEEGKIIRVNNGKSYVPPTKKATPMTATSQLRSQLGKKATPTTVTTATIKKR